MPTSVNQPFTAFPTDYSTLPTVSIVVPDLLDDMHNGTIAQGDTWLSSNLNGYIQWARTHNSLFVMIFDEDDSSSSNPSNHIPVILVGQSVMPGLTLSQARATTTCSRRSRTCTAYRGRPTRSATPR